MNPIKINRIKTTCRFLLVSKQKQAIKKITNLRELFQGLPIRSSLNHRFHREENSGNPMVNIVRAHNISQ